MIRVLLFCCLLLGLTSCASKPPVQAMAEARSAVQSVSPLYKNEASKQTKGYKYYQSAEQALLEASRALDAKEYALAKKKAKQAKLKARLAAKTKHDK